jgi:gluconokinase
MEKNQNYLIVFGVSGSGKTSVGEMLAAKLKIDFIEGDDLHPKSNIDKMKNGFALTDADRLPWLSIIKEKISEKIKNQESFILSCSALKVSYRNILREAGNIKFLFLKVDEKEVSKRLENRKGHFMPSSLLHSQMETLEIPSIKEKDVIIIDASKQPQDVLKECLTKLS